MKPLHRSLLGALVAVASIPVFLGLQACIPTFPVPVGDPERSRIDPAITGLWLTEDDGVFYMFEPYDKRTWVLSVFGVGEVDSEDCTVPDSEDAGDGTDDIDYYDASMEKMLTGGAGCYEFEGGMLWVKAWRTKLGGEWFMTWEPKGYFDPESGFERDEYMVWRIDLSVPGELRLYGIDENHDALDALEEEEMTRRKLERLIRKNTADPEFYYEQPMVIYRVRPEHLEFFGELFEGSDYDPGW